MSEWQFQPAKYVGHTSGEWEVYEVSEGSFDTDVVCRGIQARKPDGNTAALNKGDGYEYYSKADAALIADAPRLLAEVIRIRRYIGKVASLAAALKGDDADEQLKKNIEAIVQEVHG